MRKEMKIRLYIAGALSEEEKQAFEEEMKWHPEIQRKVNELKKLWGFLEKWEVKPHKVPLLSPSVKRRRFPILYPTFAFGVLGIILGMVFTKISTNRYYNYVSYIDRGFYEK